MAKEEYYHYLTLRHGQSEVNLVIGSEADNLDDACRERAKISAKYHPNQIVALTTHNCGMGPACKED